MPLSGEAMRDTYRAGHDALRGEVLSELQREEEKQDSLLGYNARLLHTGLFILAAILINALFIVTLPGYMLYWVISSFILYMVNPFILMIPGDKEKRAAFDTAAVQEIFDTVKDIVALRHALLDRKWTLGRMVWDAFFINSQPLATGFGCIFGINIIFAVIGSRTTGTLGDYTATLIILQSVAIIIFYAAIWRIKPYSQSFLNSILGMQKDARAEFRRGWRSALRVILFMGMLAAASGVLLVSAILLPGITFGSVLKSAGYAFGWSIFPIILIFLSQIVIVRYLQGAYSRELLLQFGDFKIRELQRLLQAIPAVEPGSAGDAPPRITPADLADLHSRYIRISTYKTEYHDLCSFFPVYLLIPDIFLILQEPVDSPGEPGGTGEISPENSRTGTRSG